MPAEPQPEDAAGFADGLRELGDVWRVGIDSAQVMAERVLDLYKNLPATARMVPGDSELRRLRIDLERAVDLSVDVFDRVLTLAARLDPSGDGRNRREPPEVVELDVAAGSEASTELWVHNVSHATQPAPHLRSGALTSFDGHEIPEANVRVDRAPQPIEAQNSRRVTVSIEAPEGTPAGVYHGLILSGSDANTSMRVRVRVTQ